MDPVPIKQPRMPCIPDALSLYDNTPSSLYQLVMEYLVSHLNVISTLDPETHMRSLKPNLHLPREICEQFLEVYQKNRRVTNEVTGLFYDIERTSLQRVVLRNARLTPDCLENLLQHMPRELDLVNCDFLTQDSLDMYQGYVGNMSVLRFEPSTTIPYSPDFPDRATGTMLTAPKLSTLILHRHTLRTSPSLLLLTLNLTELDLSDCVSVRSLWGLQCLTRLRSLTLYNCFCVQWASECLDWIVSLKDLQHLDISQANEKHGKFVQPNRFLESIVTSLPKLKSLDISGTNLAGTGAATMHKKGGVYKKLQVRCDIPGLASRVNNPLEFLGLYSTPHGACRRHDIPAIMVSGDANEEQILTAAAAYMNRPAVLTHVLNDLFYLFREEKNRFLGQALNIILEAMDKHPQEKHIQISGSASLFYIVKGEEKDNLKRKLKEKIIRTILKAMETHLGDDTMMRNGCLTLCQFRIPEDVMFEYERTAKILLYGVTEVDDEGFVQRIAIYLLNSLACQVDGAQKRFLGSQGAIRRMLNLAADRMINGICDDVLEIAWSTMWNVTDETPLNCQSFLNSGGMDFFLCCLRAFPNKDELLRNMMGLLGNVAEVAELRPELMTTRYITVIANLLNSSSDGIEVSYNAAGVLAHIASDGPRAWTIERPLRASVLNRVRAAVERWDLRVERNINYRSFEPILGLLQAYHTPQCQHWAAWALANLTTVYPRNFCLGVNSSRVFHALAHLVDDENTPPAISALAIKALKNREEISMQGAWEMISTLAGTNGFYGAVEQVNENFCIEPWRARWPLSVAARVYRTGYRSPLRQLQVLETVPEMVELEIPEEPPRRKIRRDEHAVPAPRGGRVCAFTKGIFVYSTLTTSILVFVFLLRFFMGEDDFGMRSFNEPTVDEEYY